MSIRDKNELFELLNCCDMEKLGKNFGLYSKYNPTFFLGLGGLWSLDLFTVSGVFPRTLHSCVPSPLTFWELCGLTGACSYWPWSSPEMLPTQLLLPLACASSLGSSWNVIFLKMIIWTMYNFSGSFCSQCPSAFIPVPAVSFATLFQHCSLGNLLPWASPTGNALCHSEIFDV